MPTSWPTIFTTDGPASGHARPEPLGPAERAALLAVAGAAVRAAVHGLPSPPLPSDLPPALDVPAGAFVTLSDAEGLRGCIGSVVPETSLAALVTRVAATAATGDPRFGALAPTQLPGLRIDVSVLSPLRRASATEIEPAVHGVVLRLGRRGAVLLPQVAARQGWDTETLLAHLAEKAGLGPAAWRDPAAALFTFTVECVEGSLVS